MNYALLIFLAMPSHAIEYTPVPADSPEATMNNFRNIDEELGRTDLTRGGTVQATAGDDFVLYVTSADQTALMTLEHDGDLIIHAGNIDIDGSGGGLIFPDNTTQTTAATSGTFTPTYTGEANVDGTTAFPCMFLRIGAIVKVDCRLNLDATTGSLTLTTFRISLPVSSDFANADECTGNITGDGGDTGNFGGVSADTANDECQADWATNSTADRTYHVTFMYRVI